MATEDLSVEHSTRSTKVIAKIVAAANICQHGHIAKTAAADSICQHGRIA